MVTEAVAMLDIFAMTQCVSTVLKVDTWICKYWMLAAVMSAHHHLVPASRQPVTSPATSLRSTFSFIPLPVISVITSPRDTINIQSREGSV